MAAPKTPRSAATTAAELPDASPAAVRELYAELLEAHNDGASSNDWTQIVDDWFTAQGFPTILYQGN